MIQWLKAHPEQAWALATAVFTTLFAPHNATQLALMARWQRRLVGTISCIGIDVPKLIRVWRDEPIEQTVVCISKFPPPLPASETTTVPIPKSPSIPVDMSIPPVTNDSTEKKP